MISGALPIVTWAKPGFNGQARKLAGGGSYPNPDLCPEGVYNLFNGQANVTAAELVSRFMLWCETQGEDIKEAAARSAIGKVMSRLGLAVMGRSGRGIGKHYEMPLLVDLQERFAGLIGEDAGIVFN